MYATLSAALLSVTLLAAAPAQTPAPSQAQPPAAAPTADDAAARQRAADQRLLQDWPNFARYRDDNAKLPPPAKDEKRVVFMGDSITDGWGRRTNSFFTGKPYVERGISGQTTPQMLVRFRADVVALKPAVVVILAGINDIAGEHRPDDDGSDSGQPGVDVRHRDRQRHPRRALVGDCRRYDFPWRRGKEPAPKVRALNAWMKQYAAANGYTYLDYYSALTDEAGGMKAGLANDGVHPTPEGYAIMAPLAEQAIATALRTKPRKR